MAAMSMMGDATMSMSVASTTLNTRVARSERARGSKLSVNAAAAGTDAGAEWRGCDGERLKASCVSRTG
ncbi:hypothetical protein MASR1M101_16240 [Gemmatimonas sp.]